MAVHDVDGAVNRIGGDGHAARQRLEQNEAIGVGAAREDEDVGIGDVPRQRLAGLVSGEADLRIARLQFCHLRAVADHILGALQVELEESLDVLLHGHAADEERDRPRALQEAALARME